MMAYRVEMSTKAEAPGAQKGGILVKGNNRIAITRAGGNKPPVPLFVPSCPATSGADMRDDQSMTDVPSVAASHRLATQAQLRS